MDEGEDYSDGAIPDYDTWSEASNAGALGRDGPLYLHKRIEKMPEKCCEVVKQKCGQTRY